MRSVRPTLRCLDEDLKLPVPPIDHPLDEIDHPVLRKASAQFAAPDGPRERIRAVDDEVLFKVKVQRWRGAVWLDASLPWLVAAGQREAGSADDFYTALATDAQVARSRYNATRRAPLTTETYSGRLLPTRDDRLRYELEAGARFVRRLEILVPELVRHSLKDGKEHVAEFGTFTLGIQVRADHGHETYVAIRITGSVPIEMSAVVLDIVPGCDPEGWYPETELPDRVLKPNEQAWSNIMDTDAAAKLLEID